MVRPHQIYFSANTVLLIRVTRVIQPSPCIYSLHLKVGEKIGTGEIAQHLEVLNVFFRAPKYDPVTHMADGSQSSNNYSSKGYDTFLGQKGKHQYA